MEMSAADTTKWLAFFDALVSAVAKSPKDCEKMAANINAVVDANKDTLERTRVAQDQGKKLPQSAQQRVMDGIDKMVPGLQQCGDNEKVRAAFSRLDMNQKSSAAEQKGSAARP
jgi:hypothetical protein